MGLKGVSFAEYDEFPSTSSLYLIIPLLSKYGHVIDAKEWFRL